MKTFTQIYIELMALVENSDSFFFKDQTLDGIVYRIFNYRLCAYSDFLLPSALDARGIMFMVDENGRARDIVSRPMQKFFNYKENPFTENVDFSKVTHIMVKEDGSLISSYIHNGELRLKSKGSLTSEQALAAMEWLDLPENRKMKGGIQLYTANGNTVNMEWTSPENRVVLGYERSRLVILNITNNHTGEFNVPLVSEFMVNDEFKNISDVEMFVTEIPNKIGIEGYVLRLEDGQMVKIKTEWYIKRHRAKDSINTPKNLFKAIIGEEIDDFIVLFKEDHTAMKIINDMTELVTPIFNKMVASVESYYHNNKGLIRKDYAIKARGLDDGFMGLYMNMYTGTQNDYVTFAQKNHEMFIGVCV